MSCIPHDPCHENHLVTENERRLPEISIQNLSSINYARLSIKVKLTVTNCLPTESNFKKLAYKIVPKVIDEEALTSKLG